MRSVRDKSTPARSWGDMLLCKHDRHGKRGKESNEKATSACNTACKSAATRDRTRDLQIFSLTLSQLTYRGFTTQSYPTSTNSSRTQAAHHASHARIHWPPASPCVMATHIDLQSAALLTISRQTSRRQPAAAYIAIAPFRPCTDAPSRTAVVCASVSSSRTVP